MDYEFEHFEAIDKWAKDFGQKSLEVIEREEPDEDGELVATFTLHAVAIEFAEHFGVDVGQVKPLIVRRAASECLQAMMRAGHTIATVSVEDDAICAITEPVRRGWTVM